MPGVTKKERLFHAVKAELEKRERQIQDLIRTINEFKAQRDQARKELNELRRILDDIVFAPRENAHEIASRALQKMNRKTEGK